MMKGDGEAPYHVFFTPNGVKAEFLFAGRLAVKSIEGSKVTSINGQTRVECNSPYARFSVTVRGKTTEVLVIDKETALTAYSIKIGGKRHLAFSKAVLLDNDGSIELLNQANNNFEISFYPRLTVNPKLETGMLTSIKGRSGYSSYLVSMAQVDTRIDVKQITDKKFAVRLPEQLPEGINDIRLTVKYTGDSGMGFVDGELVTDEFYKGIPWEIGLRKFLIPAVRKKEMVLYFRPMPKDATYQVDLQPFPGSIPDFGKARSYLKVDSITLSAEYKATLKF